MRSVGGVVAEWANWRVSCPEGHEFAAQVNPLFYHEQPLAGCSHPGAYLDFNLITSLKLGTGHGLKSLHDAPML